MNDFLTFYEDMYEELSKFGRLDCLCVCDNLGDHMVGHVYAKFCQEEDAADALQVMNGRYYDKRIMEVEYSPVTDFREARCRDFDEGSCARGGFCNFMHVKPVPIIMIQDLEDEGEDWRRDEEDRLRMRRGSGRGSGGSRDHRSRSRSVSGDDRSHEEGQSRSRSSRDNNGRDRDRDKGSSSRRQRSSRSARSSKSRSRSR